jgi:hypothetical protein
MEAVENFQKKISCDVIISRRDAAGSAKKCFFEPAGYYYGREYML